MMYASIRMPSPPLSIGKSQLMVTVVVASLFVVTMLRGELGIELAMIATGSEYSLQSNRLRALYLKLNV